MPRGLAICAVVALVGCSTPQEQAARIERDRAGYLEALTQHCELLGFRRDSAEMKQCLLTIHAQNLQNQPQNTQPQYRRERQRQPVTTNCQTYGGQTTCQTR